MLIGAEAWLNAGHGIVSLCVIVLVISAVGFVLADYFDGRF